MKPVWAWLGWFGTCCLMVMSWILMNTIQQERKLADSLQAQKDWCYRNMQIIERSNKLKDDKLKEYEQRPLDVFSEHELSLQQLQGLINVLQQRIRQLEEKP